MEPTLPSQGLPGESPSPEPPAEPDKPRLADRLELAGALVAGVVALDFLAVIVGMFGGGAYRNVGDRIELLSLNLDAKTGLLLLVAAIFITFPELMDAKDRPERTVLGRRTLMAIAGLGVAMAVIALIGIGLDLSRNQPYAYVTNQGSAVLHRLAIVLMAVIAAGWALAALGVRVITTKR
jgi:hypothetical protein